MYRDEKGYFHTTSTLDPNEYKQSADNLKSQIAQTARFSQKIAIAVIILVFIVTLVVLGLIGFAFYSQFSSLSNPTFQVATTYSTPETSEDSMGDYLKYLQSNAEHANTETERIAALTQEASQYISLGDLKSAKNLLDSIVESDLKTYNEQYLYNLAYFHLYSENGLNNSELATEYHAKLQKLLEAMNREFAESSSEDDALESEDAE